MDYKRFEAKRQQRLDERKKERAFRSANPDIAYEHMRYIHLPANFTMTCLKEEDWRVLGGKFPPQDFEAL